jgi:HAD superfamily hydrolase (TIGR01509 family)
MSSAQPASPATAMTTALKAILFDVDGTLVDSNDAHAAAWIQAFADHRVMVDPLHVRRCIGMGGDKLMPAVSGIESDSAEGVAISERRGAIFTGQLLPTLRPFKDADKLVAEVKRLGLTAVAASSAKKDELKALLGVAQAGWLMDSTTSSDDAEHSKPAPDIIIAALQRANAEPDEAIMIGDTPYDIEAARRAGVRTIAFRSGGWSDGDLSGAIEIYDGAWDLLARLGDSAAIRVE